MDEPTFFVRKKLLSKLHYVVAQWSDGSKIKVGRFPTKPEAERWIHYKSRHWLKDWMARGRPAA
jgi:hypothetical protein